MGYCSQVAFQIDGKEKSCRALLAWLETEEPIEGMDDSHKWHPSPSHALQNILDGLETRMDEHGFVIRFHRDSIKWDMDVHDGIWQRMADKAEELGLNVAYRRLGEDSGDMDYDFRGDSPDYDSVDYLHVLMPSWKGDRLWLDAGEVRLMAGSVYLSEQESEEIVLKAIEAARAVIDAELKRRAA